MSGHVYVLGISILPQFTHVYDFCFYFILEIFRVWYFVFKYFVYFSFYHEIFLISGLDCLHCTNVAIGRSVPLAVRLAANRLIAPLTKPECVGAQSATAASGITLDKCTAAPQTGQVNKCGTLIGTLTVSVNVVLITLGNFVCSFYVTLCTYDNDLEATTKQKQKQKTNKQINKQK